MDFTIEYRMRILRLIETLTLGAAAVGYLTESMHAAGAMGMIARTVCEYEGQAGPRKAAYGNAEE